MKMQKLGAIEISKVTELPGLAMQATSLMPNITAEILAEGRTWLGPQFIDPAAEIVYLSFHSYVVKTPRHIILVDTCCSNDKPRKSVPALAQAEHAVFAGTGGSVFTPRGYRHRVVHAPARRSCRLEYAADRRTMGADFSQCALHHGPARYEHWHRLHAANPPAPVNRGSFADSVLPVVERGQAMMVASDFCVDIELGEGVWLEPSPGHSPGHVCVHVTGGGQHALLAGDAIHHPVQLTHPHLSIAADFDRAQAEATRRHMLERCADTPTLLLTAHFPSPTAGRVVGHKDSFRFKFA